MSKKKAPDIYPPEFPDPLLPGGIPSEPDPEGLAKDAYLGELARDVEAGEAEPGPPLPFSGDATERLKQITLGQLNPELPIAGAAISFCARVGNWRDAIALRVAWVNDQGNVAVDLEWGDRNAVTGVPYGDGIRCWKFRAE